MLDKTPKEISERSALKINPAKTCQPVGAMYAALGIHGCLPHSHGSQGCCSFHRMHLTRHFRDPIMASTSSFTEGASVFGGRTNLQAAVKNIFSIYNPDIIAVHTTCLSETIGDGVPSIIKACEVPEGKMVIHTNTPSYVGSHITGYSNMVKSIVKYFAQESDKSIDTVNIIPGFVNPGDIREIKRLVNALEVHSIVFPDTSDVVDTPMTGRYDMYPKGGTTQEELKATGTSSATLALGKFSSEAAAFELERQCGVPANVLKTPIGIKATDEFLMKLMSITGAVVPKELEAERGRVVDIMTDTHHHFHGKTVAIFGDPDIVIGMTEFAISLGMIPKYVVTGTPGNAFEAEVNGMLSAAGITGSKVKAAGDLFDLQQWMKNEPVDLLIGNSYGKYIARAENTPLVRMGFPILDRSVHSYLPIVGYAGAMRIIEMISNALLDEQDRTCADEDLELVM